MSTTLDTIRFYDNFHIANDIYETSDKHMKRLLKDNLPAKEVTKKPRNISKHTKKLIALLIVWLLFHTLQISQATIEI